MICYIIHRFRWFFQTFVGRILQKNSNCPEAVKDGSKAPGRTDAIPNAIDTGIAITRHTTNMMNTAC